MPEKQGWIQESPLLPVTAKSPAPLITHPFPPTPLQACWAPAGLSVSSVWTFFHYLPNFGSAPLEQSTGLRVRPWILALFHHSLCGFSELTAFLPQSPYE